MAWGAVMRPMPLSISLYQGVKPHFSLGKIPFQFRYNPFHGHVFYTTFAVETRDKKKEVQPSNK